LKSDYLKAIQGKIMPLKKIIRWAERFIIPDEVARRQFEAFQDLLREDRKCLRLITRLEEIVHRPIVADWSRIALLIKSLSDSAKHLVNCLEQMRPNAYPELLPSYDRIHRQLLELFPPSFGNSSPPYALSLEQAYDHPDLVGYKAYSLARIIRQTTIPVPPGFVVTINAYQSYLEKNDLSDIIDKQLRTLNLQRHESLQKASLIMRQAMLEGTIPSEVENSIVSMLENINSKTDFPSWAVRSSAVGEDGEVSFAGQYDTLLNVSREDIFTAYKTVLAGKYSIRALTYRLHNAISDAETPMAVLFLPMINARTSGVVYTLDPLDKCAGACLVICAVPGLGGSLVEGASIPDIILVSRHDTTHFLDKQAAIEKNNLVSQTMLQKEPDKLCLDDQSAMILAKWGLELENLAGSPQDIEWTQDQENKIFVLQSRTIPQSLGKSDKIDVPISFPENHGFRPLRTGTPASAGIAAGKVYRISDEADMEQVPQNAVLLTRGIPPYLVGLLKKIVAVIAEKGSKASHFASIAREFGLPVIVSLGDMKGILEQGQIVTVDAYEGAVYDGVVEELVSWHDHQKIKSPSAFQKKLIPLLSLVSSLSLIDPSLSEFSAENCRSFHDLVRFVHEKGTREMFSLVDITGPGMRKAKPLETEIPIVMHVLDLSDGLVGHSRKLKAVTPGHFKSIPMRAVWEGLTDTDVSWSKGLLHMDWQRFDQLSGGIMSLRSSFLGSYALLAKHYAHLLLRFGYHFAVLDTISGNRTEENYIQFRFKGGGGSPEKKMWRLAMMERVLKEFKFRVMIREDMLEAGCKRLDREANELRLNILGYLLGRTPLLDMALDSRENALQMADDMLNKWRMKESFL
jgi:pyruvate, water dikinase